MTQLLTIVNASLIIPDSEIKAAIPAFQTQIDRDFMPHWHTRVKGPFVVTFVPASIIYSTPGDQWPIDPHAWPFFLNNHSNDEGALGWHTDDAAQNFPIHSRTFVGDCIRFGLKWQTTLSHEVLETIADPLANKVYKMHSGDLAALEVCDAVEADEQAYDIDGVPMSNFVFPSYFSMKHGVIYDRQGRLGAPCPSLTEGGYMSIYKKSEGWTQVQAMKADGMASRRAILRAHSFRRDLRHMSSVLEEV